MPYARLHAEYLTKNTGLAPTLIQDIDFKEAYYKEIPEWIIKEALKRLPKNIRKVLKEFYEGGYPYRKIAEVIIEVA